MLVHSAGFMVHGKSKSTNYELRTHNQSAFTLVELLISVLIILMIAVVAIPNVKKFSQDQQIEDAASNVTQVLKLAQSSAMSSIKCSPILDSLFWTVEFNQYDYRLIAKCSNGVNITHVSDTNYIKNRPGLVKKTDFGINCLSAQKLSIRFTGSGVSSLCNDVALSGTITSFSINLQNTEKTTSVRSIIVEKGGIINKQ